MRVTIFINTLCVIFLMFSFFKDKNKTEKSLRFALITMRNMAPLFLSLILLIGIFFGIFSDKITLFFGYESGVKGFLFLALLGSIIQMPSLLAFPLAGSFLDKGASIGSVAVFITTLTMIGIVTLPLEIKTMGIKFAILRNLFSFLVAILIAFLMRWMLL